MPKPRATTLDKVCAQCSAPFQVPDKVNYREKLYCTRACSNRATATKRAESVRSAKRYTPPICPCGNEVQPPAGQTHVYANQRKHCSPECRKKYTVWRQKNPENHLTFTCQNCGDEFTRPRSQAGHGKYCSSRCAQKHTRVKKHIIVDDAVVLDSGYEVLFWGLCAFLKIQVERFDRNQCIELDSGNFYGPDFYLPVLDVYVEVKGFEDEDDRNRYAAWRQKRSLVVVDTDMLGVLRADSRGDFEKRLRLAVTHPKT